MAFLTNRSLTDLQMPCGIWIPAGQGREIPDGDLKHHVVDAWLGTQMLWKGGGVPSDPKVQPKVKLPV